MIMHDDDQPVVESALLDNVSRPRELVIALKKTRRGRIRRVVREVYLRDDITCGIYGCEICDPQQKPSMMDERKRKNE